MTCDATIYVPVIVVLAWLVYVLGVRSVRQQRRIKGLDVRVAELERLRLIDPLTGLANREAAMTAIHAACEVDSGSVLAFIDIDRFKAVNDEWGHTAGDGALVAVAGHLRAAVEDRGLAARLAGDEFVVLTEDAAIVRRVGETLAAGLLLGDGGLVVRASMGCVRAGRYMTARDALRGADEAMYAAKRGGVVVGTTAGR